ncbi:hypothetical protein HRI_002274000 [Hibiscus trionum]|uniref:BZIP domain-containing protein n=1 Tax=Hibiscus trionum TaxID=183268 RepID=A0A9W7HZ38_HIBTR|nr:hypothetical protein HRI_002274000 [Hibiscus trionum]
MEGYSSAGSTTPFIAEMQDAPLPLYDVDSLTPDEVEKIMMQFRTEYTETHSSQLETSEASFQTETGCSRPKLTPAQRKENKRKSDIKFRQKLKKKGDEQTAEIKRLKVENERLNAENRMLKVHIRLLQLQAAAPVGQDSCITQSTDHQLQHPTVSPQPPPVLLV